MINLCADCPNIRCKTLCKEAYEYSQQGSVVDRRGKDRKVLYGFDMERFPDPIWAEGFAYKSGAIDMRKFIKLLPPRQLRVWKAIQDWMEVDSKDKDFRGELSKSLRISRWSFNRELRIMKGIASQCILEGL